jgi:diguanylate cyclase (GGDEF)-like protein/PAS domain S-box-containing protein
MPMDECPADTTLYARIVEQVPDGLVLTDARAGDHPITHANRAFETLTGYRREQVLGRHPRFLLPEDAEPETHRDLASCLAADSSTTLIMPGMCLDGSCFWIELTTMPLRDEHGQISHCLVMLRDNSPLVSLREQVQLLEHELELSSRELVKLATRDTLTTLYNRRYFLKRLEREWQRCLHDQCPLVLFNIGLDDFKHFNEAMGTHAGDECLQRVAHILQTSFPLNTDVVARYGSVEFIASSDGMTEAAALELAESIRRRVWELPRQDQDGQHLSASIGLVSGLPGRDLDPPRFMSAVSRALADAKRQGGGRVCLRSLRNGG